MEMTVFKKLVPVIGLLMLAGPVVFAADSPSTPATTTHTTKSKTHHSHHHSKKKSSSTTSTKPSG